MEYTSENNRWIPDMTDDEYHADKSRIGSSGISTLFIETEADFHYQQTHGKEASPAMELSKTIHELTFYPDARHLVKVAPSVDRRTKEGKQEYAEWFDDLPPGAKILSPNDADAVLGVQTAILNHPKASKLFSGGIAEQAGYFEHELEVINPDGSRSTVIIPGKIKPDFRRNDGIIVDLKAYRKGDASPKGFSYAVRTRGYLIQAAWYSLGYRAIMGRMPKAFTFVVVEKEPPYLVGCYIVEEAQLELGMKQVEIGLRKYYKGIQTGLWPGYSENIEPLLIPESYFESVKIYE